MHDWQPAKPLPVRRGGKTFLFAGPALARKGAYAMRDAMAGLEIDLLIERPGEECPDFWNRIDVRQMQSLPEELAGVVLPAIVERRPATLLRALAAGLPVIATTACGLPPQPGLTLIPPCDPRALRTAVAAAMA